MFKRVILGAIVVVALAGCVPVAGYYGAPGGYAYGPGYGEAYAPGYVASPGYAPGAYYGSPYYDAPYASGGVFFGYGYGDGDGGDRGGRGRGGREGDHGRDWRRDGGDHRDHGARPNGAPPAAAFHPGPGAPPRPGFAQQRMGAPSTASAAPRGAPGRPARRTPGES